MRYTAEDLHGLVCTTELTEAEDYLISAFNQIRQAEKSPEMYRRMDFFRSLRAIVDDYLETNKLSDANDEQENAIARMIGDYLNETRADRLGGDSETVQGDTNQ